VRAYEPAELPQRNEPLGGYLSCSPYCTSRLVGERAAYSDGGLGDLVRESPERKKAGWWWVHTERGPRSGSDLSVVITWSRPHKIATRVGHTPAHPLTS
jgi:hypothetical protein